MIASLLGLPMHLARHLSCLAGGTDEHSQSVGH